MADAIIFDDNCIVNVTDYSFDMTVIEFTAGSDVDRADLMFAEARRLPPSCLAKFRQAGRLQQTFVSLVFNHDSSDNEQAVWDLVFDKCFFGIVVCPVQTKVDLVFFGDCTFDDVH